MTFSLIGTIIYLLPKIRNYVRVSRKTKVSCLPPSSLNSKTPLATSSLDQETTM